jgi:hypothetical protein
MVLRRLLIISGAPAANTLEAEDVVTAFEQADLLPAFQNRLETDLTLGIIRLVVLLDLAGGHVAGAWVQIHALFFVLAVALEEELTHDLFLIVFQVGGDAVVVIFLIILDSLDHVLGHFTEGSLILSRPEGSNISHFRKTTLFVLLKNNHFVLLAVVSIIILKEDFCVVDCGLERVEESACLAAL